jgi:hypothetical protein
MFEPLQQTLIHWIRAGGVQGLVLAMTVENLVQVVPSLVLVPWSALSAPVG